VIRFELSGFRRLFLGLSNQTTNYQIQVGATVASALQMTI